MSKKRVVMDPSFIALLFPSFLNAFEGTGQSNVTLNLDVGASNAMTAVDDYLQKGERLVDLARTVYRKKMSEISLSAAEQQIYSFAIDEKMSMYDVIRKISKAFTRPCLINMEHCDDEYAQCLKELVAMPGISVDFSFVDESAERERLHVAQCIGASLPDEEKVIKLTFHETDYPDIEYFGAKNTTHRKSKDHAWRNRNGTLDNFLRVTDIADFLSSLIIYTQVMRVIRSFYCFSNEEKQSSVMYQEFSNVCANYIAQFLDTDVFGVGNETKPSSMDDLKKLPLFVHEKKLLDHALEKYLADNGIVIAPQKKYSFRLENTGGSLIAYGVSDFFDVGACFLMDEKYVFPYHNFICCYNADMKFWGLPIGIRYRSSSKVFDTDYMKLFMNLFRIVSDAKGYQKKILDYYRELEKKGHAKSYQLKKNIPQKVVNSMEKSLFNQYFGFVEFDEETDLEKIDELAKEFLALKDTYLTNVDSSDNAIRFRRLGNHKAGGLYYPSIKCLCVDIHSPSTLVHEYGHLIDYSMNDLSSMADFLKIKDYYVNYLKMQAKQDKDFAAQIAGRTKYNLSYYAMPTEIFARSFELFVSKVLGVRNSIVPVDFKKNVYPDTEEFLNMIGDYFCALLGIEKISNETVRWLVSCPVGDGNFISHLNTASAAEIRAALNDEKVASQRSKVAKLKSALKKVSGS